MLLGLLILSFVISVLFLLNAIRKRKERRSGWKINRSGRDMHEYFELYEGKWRSIEIDREMYVKGMPRHGVYLPKDWTKFPIWAQERKEIIISRIKEELKPPTFTIMEYE